MRKTERFKETEDRVAETEKRDVGVNLTSTMGDSEQDQS